MRTDQVWSNVVSDWLVGGGEEGNERPSPGLEAVLAMAPFYHCLFSVLAEGSNQYLSLTPSPDPPASSFSPPQYPSITPPHCHHGAPS